MKKLPTAIAYSVFCTGLALLLLSIVSEEGWQSHEVLIDFIRELGLLLSASMAGTLLYEVFVREQMTQEMITELSVISEKTAREFRSGFRPVDNHRRGYSGYYKWVLGKGQQDLMFAGRSVLHRIDSDVRSNSNIALKAEEVLYRKLEEGSQIRIYFLDPSIDILERLATEEGQQVKDMLADIATSIAICRALASKIEIASNKLPKTAGLSIRIYNKVPYFAYHRQNDEVYIGFYFQSLVGSTSAVYEVLDEKTKQQFWDHFASIHGASDTYTLVEFDSERGKPFVNHKLIGELIDKLSTDDHIGKNKMEELLARLTD